MAFLRTPATWLPFRADDGNSATATVDPPQPYDPLTPPPTRRRSTSLVVQTFSVPDDCGSLSESDEDNALLEGRSSILRAMRSVLPPPDPNVAATIEPTSDQVPSGLSGAPEPVQGRSWQEVKRKRAAKPGDTASGQRKGKDKAVCSSTASPSVPPELGALSAPAAEADFGGYPSTSPGCGSSP